VNIAAFAIDRTEVTFAAYLRCVEARCCSPAGTDFRCSAGDRLSSRSALPITCVDYEQAAQYCAWAGKRLPTELEWEYAARGEPGRSYPWGDAPVSATMLCSRQSEPCSVASRPRGATPEGVFDLAGIVWEWTQSDNCGREPADCHKGYKVVKGGPLVYEHDEAVQARSAFRQSVPVGRRDWDLGFRCAR
jgi:eukaryotic-like serine/threonine-protein kinase